MSVVVSKFYFDGAGSDCPTTGFEVIRTEGQPTEIKKGDFLLDSDLVTLMENGVEVVVGFLLR